MRVSFNPNISVSQNKKTNQNPSFQAANVKLVNEVLQSGDLNGPLHLYVVSFKHPKEDRLATLNLLLSKVGDNFRIEGFKECVQSLINSVQKLPR